MNIFFDDYINSKTTLKQFVDQYDSTLRMKVEKEAIADFFLFNIKIPCLSHYPLETQFKKAYTIAKFKEVQDELRRFLYLTTSFLGCEGATQTYIVVNENKVSEKLIKRANFIVHLDEDPWGECRCTLFEFKGIVCRYSLRILAQLGKSIKIYFGSVDERYKEKIHICQKQL